MSILHVIGLTFFSMPPVLKDRENDSWCNFSPYYPGGGGWRGDWRCASFPSLYVNNVAPPPLERHWTSLSECCVPDWLSAASLEAAQLPGCSCQTQVWIITDVLSRRPATPRASFIQPQNKKSCKWGCLLCHRLFWGDILKYF